MPENRTPNWLQNSGQDITAKEIWPSNSPKLNQMVYQVWGNVKRSITGTFQTEDNRRTQGNSAGDSLSRGPI